MTTALPAPPRRSLPGRTPSQDMLNEEALAANRRNLERREPSPRKPVTAATSGVWLATAGVNAVPSTQSNSRILGI